MGHYWKNVLFGRARHWPRGSAAKMAEGLSRASVGLPALLSVYALTRWLQLWPGTPLAVLVVWCTACWWHRRTPQSRSEAERLAVPSTALDLALLLLFLVILLAPIGRLFLAATTEPTPRFYFHDEAYLIAIARGQAQDFPPPDLLWSGAKSAYHQGGALFTEAVARLSGLSVHSAYYGLVPILLRLCLVGASWRLLERLFPTWSFRRRLGAVAFAAGLFFVDPVAVAWNLRDIAVNRRVDLDILLEGVPIVGSFRISGAYADQYFSGPLADVMMLGAVASLGYSGALPVGAALAVPYLIKAQGGLPVILGLLAGLGVAAPFRREAREALVPLGVAAPFLWLYRSFGPRTSDLLVSVGLGANLRWLERQGAPYAAALESGVLLVALAAGAIWTLGRFLLPLGLAAAGALFAVRESQQDAELLLAALTGAIGTALAFATLVVVQPGLDLQAKFEVTHRASADLLWRPYDGYLDYMFTEVSAAVPNTFVLLGVALLAGAGALEWERRERGGFRRTVACGLVLCGWLTLVGNKAVAAGPGYQAAAARSKVVDPLAVEALRQIPVRGSVVITNDLAYDANVAPHLPYMNAWAPAVFGHQFWVADFMFDLHYPNIRERFADWHRFWETSADHWHTELLTREKIDWILQRRGIGALDPAQIEGVRLVYENAEYRVLARRTEPTGTR